MYSSIKLTLFLSFCVGVKFCLTSREEHRLRVCESRVVRRIFDMKGEVGIEGCRRLHSELHVCYSSPDFFLSSPDIINIIHNVACSMHIVKKKGIQTSLKNLNRRNHIGDSGG